MSSLRTKPINPPSVPLLAAIRLIVWLGCFCLVGGRYGGGEELSFAQVHMACRCYGLVACPSFMSVFLSWMYTGAEGSPQRLRMDPHAHIAVLVAATKASRQERTAWFYGWELISRERAPGLHDPQCKVEGGGQFWSP